MKATLFIRKEHEAIRALLENYQKTTEKNLNGKHALAGRIRREVTIYSNLETQVLYPELRNRISKAADEFMENAAAEHEAIDDLLMSISANSAENDVDERVMELGARITRHMALEEEQILEEARSRLSEQRLEELGLDLEARRKLLTQLAA